jgi:hypothetical protein
MPYTVTMARILRYMSEQNKIGDENTEMYMPCCRVWGSHSGRYDEFHLLRHNGMQPGESQPMFQRNMLPLKLVDFQALHPKGTNATCHVAYLYSKTGCFSIPPRSLLHLCHYSRGTSIRWTVDTLIIELLNSCSKLEAMFLLLLWTWPCLILWIPCVVSFVCVLCRSIFVFWPVLK